MQDYIKVVLPQSYDLVVGDTFQLFYRGIIEAVNPYHYDILALCEKGSNYPRYYEFTPEEEGEYTLTINVYGNDKTLLASGQTLLKVAAANVSPKEPVHILCVGDSLTSNGIWVSEAYRRLTASDGDPIGHGLSGFRFIGTCQKDGAGYEGYGGWSWYSYLHCGYKEYAPVWVSCKHDKTAADQHSMWQDETGARWILETIEENRLKFKRHAQHVPKPEAGHIITHIENALHTDSVMVEDSVYEAPNPFWNESTLEVDFIQYCQKHNFDHIDAVYVMLSWNGQGPDRPPIKEHCQNLTTRAKEFADILHKQYPNAVLKIMGLQIPSINGGTGFNYGAKLPYCDDYEQTRYVLELNRAYEAFALEDNYRNFVEFINISGQFDSEYNMPSAPRQVNVRNKQTEIVGINGVHPTPEGYLQIGDAAYRNMVKSFCR